MSKFSTVWCLSNFVVKVHCNRCDQVLLEWHFRKKFTITAAEVVLIHLFSLTVVSKQKLKIKSRNTMAHSWHFHESIFLLFGSWSMVCISMFGLSQSFSDNSNLIILVDIQRLHENGKLILCFSNAVYFV